MCCKVFQGQKGSILGKNLSGVKIDIWKYLGSWKLFLLFISAIETKIIEKGSMPCVNICLYLYLRYSKER